MAQLQGKRIRFFRGIILYVWQSSSMKHSTAILRVAAFFPPWGHLIVSYGFCCSWGFCAFLTPISLLTAGLMWPALWVPLCGGQRVVQGHVDIETPRWAGPDVFPVCRAASGSSLGVSMTHSFVLQQRAERPLIPRSVFRRQNIRAPSILNV